MSNQETDSLTGQCLCGDVSFSFAREDLKSVDACHCGQCRQWSGNYWASVNISFDALKFTSDGTFTWYRASNYARRGFCSKCGSSLFWHADKLDDHKDRVAVALGSLNGPTGLALTEHIFVADKGDYYDIADGLPQKQKY